jgi:hypothetical protein
MKAWSAALAGELSRWPHVRARSFFGLTAFYRGEKIFALLPHTRGIETASSIAFKLESASPAVRRRLENDNRIDSVMMQRASWFTFRLSSDADLRNALNCLSEAYQAGTNTKKPK